MDSVIENLDSVLTKVSTHATKCNLVPPDDKCSSAFLERLQKTLVIEEARISNPGVQLFMNTVLFTTPKGSFKNRALVFGKFTL